MNADLARNILCCDQMIASYEARIENAETTEENVADLKKDLEGYSEKRAELLEEASDSGDDQDVS